MNLKTLWCIILTVQRRTIFFSERDAVMDVFAMLEEAIAIIKKMLDDFKAWIAIYFPQEEE